MLPRRYIEDLTASPDELEETKTAEAAGPEGSAIGGGIGTALGAIAGGLIGGIPTAGAGAIPGATLGAGVGGSLGTALGGFIGGGIADDASKKAQAAALKRQTAITQEQLYQDALNRFLSTG
jgi:phage tail tape-measure protein